MAKVTNTSKGPRGIRNASGDIVMIEAGQSADDDFSAAEVKDFNAALAYEAGEQPGAAEEADDGGEPGPLDGNIDSLGEHVAGIEDVAAIDELIAAETAGKSRRGALDVLEARKAELEAPAE